MSLDRLRAIVHRWDVATVTRLRARVRLNYDGNPERLPGTAAEVPITIDEWKAALVAELERGWRATG